MPLTTTERTVQQRSSPERTGGLESSRTLRRLTGEALERGGSARMASLGRSLHSPTSHNQHVGNPDSDLYEEYASRPSPLYDQWKEDDRFVAAVELMARYLAEAQILLSSYSVMYRDLAALNLMNMLALSEEYARTNHSRTPIERATCELAVEFKAARKQFVQDMSNLIPQAKADRKPPERSVTMRDRLR